MISRAPSRATSSITSPSSRSPLNKASISARIFSVGDTRTDTGVVPSFDELAALEGTYVRCHLHQRRDTTISVSPEHWPVRIRVRNLDHVPAAAGLRLGSVPAESGRPSGLPV